MLIVLTDRQKDRKRDAAAAIKSAAPRSKRALRSIRIPLFGIAPALSVRYAHSQFLYSELRPP